MRRKVCKFIYNDIGQKDLFNTAIKPIEKLDLDPNWSVISTVAKETKTYKNSD
jgi:hypothetical protein